MKRTVEILLFLLIAFTSFSQSTANEAFYMLDANMKAAPQEKAVYFIHSFKIHDSCWQFDTYNVLGPIISSEQYKDDKGNEASGMFCYYNKSGKMDSCGKYLNGFQDGSWYLINDTGRAFIQKDYKGGQLLFLKDLIKLDSVKKLEESAKAVKPDTNEVEADFVGGSSRWLYYLGKHMVYPERAMNAEKQGKVIVQFIIDEEGNVTFPQIVQSVEYSLDQEALRLIKNSPTWKPATQNGKLVKAYKLQPITFKLTEN